MPDMTLARSTVGRSEMSAEVRKSSQKAELSIEVGGIHSGYRVSKEAAATHRLLKSRFHKFNERSHTWIDVFAPLIEQIQRFMC